MLREPAIGDGPQLDGGIITARRQHVVIEWVPRRVIHSGGVSVQSWISTGNLAGEAVRDDLDGAATTPDRHSKELAITTHIVVVTRHRGQLQVQIVRLRLYRLGKHVPKSRGANEAGRRLHTQCINSAHGLVIWGEAMHGVQRV